MNKRVEKTIQCRLLVYRKKLSLISQGNLLNDNLQYYAACFFLYCSIVHALIVIAWI